MEIKLSQKLRELRRRDGVTQEALANHLGISVQSVSKWECGDGFPDISLLPGIAAYYNVSVDTLLGVDEEEKGRRIHAICDRYNEIRHHEPREDGSLYIDHGIDEGISLMRDAIREFPHCYFFCQLLASDLWWKSKSVTQDEKNELLCEAEMLCGRVLSAPDAENRWRHAADSILCMIYVDSGRTEMALENAYQSADITDTIDWKLSKILKGDELKAQLSRNLREFLRRAYMSARSLDDIGGDFSAVTDNPHTVILMEYLQKVLNLK